MEEIDILYKLIDVADDRVAERLELLFRLKFIAGFKILYGWRTSVLDKLDTCLDPIAVVIFALLVAVIDKQWGRIVFFTLAFLVAYIRWIKSQRSKNVDDAMTRKDKANSMIIDHAELLLPYVGNVFDFEARYAQQHLDDIKRAKIDMYVFTEIDNLEFVFDKSRAGLIEDKYTLRAIKIFVARAENEGFFNVARKLIFSGRYNVDFTRAAENLLYVGRFDSSKLAT